MVLNPFYSPQYVRFEQLAPAYDSTATYSVGDYVTYEYNLYQCTTAVTTAGAFDPSKWNMVDVTDQLTDDLTIASSATAVNPSVTNSADGLIQDVKMYGRSRKSRNILDPNKVMSGFNFNNDVFSNVLTDTFTDFHPRITADGSVVTLSGIFNLGENRITFSIPATTTLIIKHNGQTRNLDIVSLSNVPAGDYVWSFNFLENDPTTVGCLRFSKMMICSAADYDVDPAYEPYGILSIGDSGSLDVQTCGKNLLNPATIGLYQATSNPSVIRAGFAPIYVHAGTYTLSYNRSTTDVTLWITDMSDYSYQQVQPNDQYVVSSDTYIMVRSGLDTVTEFNNIFTNIQLELGSTATPYEPYISSTASLTTGLPLCGIPVTTGETYTDGDGVKWLADTADVEGVVKRTYKVTFDGSEDWNVVSSSATGTSGSKRIITGIQQGIKSHSAYTAGNLICALNNVSADNIQKATIDNAISIGETNNNNGCSLRISGISTAEALKTYLASNPVTVVYELEEPITTPLTAEEQQLLLNLKTYDNVTNVTITDDPFVDISYIKNTANGKATEQLADNLRASIGWIFAVPEMHRNILRGKYLGSAVSAAQLAAIADGSFDDLYVGDYWTIPVTIDGTTLNVNWRIADIDYYLNTGDTPLTAHHLVIVPDTGLYTARMNATNINTGGYKASEMYTTNLGTAKTVINTAFPDMVLTHRDLMPGNPADSPTWADSTVELLSEIMTYGTQIMSPCNGSGQYNIFWTIAKSQLALFRFGPWFGVADDTYWLRDVVGSPSFAAVSAEGTAEGWGASNELGVRPYFLLGDANNV